jgi:hypothetical protein
MIFLACKLKLEINYYRVLYNVMKDFGFFQRIFLEDFFEDYSFCMVKHLSFHNSSSSVIEDSF